MSKSKPKAPTALAASVITIDVATLQGILHHAASAARLVGHLDDASPRRRISDGPLGDHLDAIVRKLTELLGDPHTLAAPVQSARWFVIGTDDESMRPHMGRFRPTPHALLLRSMSSDVAGAALWWRRGAAVAGLLVLVELLARLLGSCGGAR
jgi:hypothetical protein